MNEKKNIIFVCSRNKWRSKTAETIFRDRDGWNVRSAGTSKSAEKKISLNLINWADEIFVMERKHKEIIEKRFGRIEKDITILDIPDEYMYMNPELIDELKSIIGPE